MKVCLIAIARDEDSFLDEWFRYNIDLGFDHIFLIDNNDFGNEIKNTVANVTVIPFNGVTFGSLWYELQAWIYNHTLEYVKLLDYDYVSFLDIDEFLTFNSYKDIKEFIQNEMIEKGENLAEVGWVVYDDNGIIWEKDTKDNVLDTYTTVQHKISQDVPFNSNEVSWSKSIMKINKETRIFSPHWPDVTILNGKFYKTNHIDKSIAFIKHFRTKCLETFIKHKMMQCHAADCDFGKNAVRSYFSINEITKEKIDAFYQMVEEYKLDGCTEELEKMKSEIEKAP